MLEEGWLGVGYAPLTQANSLDLNEPPPPGLKNWRPINYAGL